MSALPSWAHRLPDDRALRSAFVAALRDCQAAAVGPYWHQIRTYLDSEQANQIQAMANGGIGQVLATLHPRIRWRDPTLEVLDRPGPSSDQYLAGKGLILTPSVFCRTALFCVSTVDPDEPNVLFYPAIRDITDASRLWAPRDRRSADKALAALLGTTRARAMEIISDGCTTTELARRLNVSIATASHHATVLRQAGLIATHRHGPSVQHTITPLGTALLNGSPYSS